MRIDKDDLELGTKVYRYRLDNNNYVYLKEGVIDISKWTGDKIIKYSDNSIRGFNSTDIPFHEYHAGEVLLLKEDILTAMELFIKHEEYKIKKLYDEIEERKNRIADMKLGGYMNEY